MEVSEAIKQRRSVRRYTADIPAEADIQQILEAGVWAPSGLNNQPWKFKIVRDKGQSKGLAKFTKYGGIIQDAPVNICVFLDNSATYNREKDIMSVGACIQNMLLQARALKLGSCWLGEILNRREDVEKYLKVPPDFELMAVISVGYSDEGIEKGSRKKLKSFLLD